VSLKQIAEVRRGFTTGANEFFYLTEEEIKRQGIEKEFWMHQERGKWVPNYVIKSPRECKSIVVKPEDLKYRVLMIHKDKKDLKRTNILKYIESGERKGYHLRPTCVSRESWYDLGERKKPGLVWIKGIWDRHFLPITTLAYADQQLYEVYPNKKSDLNLIAASLNSSYTSVFAEFNARVNLGEGILWIATYEAANMLTVDPQSVQTKLLKNRLVHVIRELSNRSIGSVFSELGVASPAEVSLDKVKSDRRELDKIIMGEILGLTDEEQLEVYRAVIDLVKSRIEKAKSFGKRKKTKEGIDIDLLVKLVMEKVGGETLGKFYTEKVLSQPSLETKSLPPAGGDVRIQQSLMGCRLYSGKKSIDCSSELEARYLKVWLEVGLDQVKVPRDERHLQTIMPELENLKQKIDEIIAPYLNSIVNVKTRDRILHQLQVQITKGVQGD
jgi:hypothetical protein